MLSLLVGASYEMLGEWGGRGTKTTGCHRGLPRDRSNNDGYRGVWARQHPELFKVPVDTGATLVNSLTGMRHVPRFSRLPFSKAATVPIGGDTAPTHASSRAAADDFARESLLMSLESRSADLH
jgi:hypothetical protein